MNNKMLYYTMILSYRKQKEDKQSPHRQTRSYYKHCFLHSFPSPCTILTLDIYGKKDRTKESTGVLSCFFANVIVAHRMRWTNVYRIYNKQAHRVECSKNENSSVLLTLKTSAKKKRRTPYSCGMSNRKWYHIFCFYNGFIHIHLVSKSNLVVKSFFFVRSLFALAFGT